MKGIILTLFICFASQFLLAQNSYRIKGSVADTVANVKLYNTTVVVLNAKDSTLRKFTRAAEDGTFNIVGLNKGKFILLVSYPNYADYVENFSLDSLNKEHDFKRISMLLKARLLAGVIIKGTRAAIKIKGDTTEFDASSFKVQPNAKVEDLLKQLPGIQVDKDGKITAQGQVVNKVLVDGEEFFGDDPTLVTKNIRSDMVDKVQLYDKSSDQAAFTGVDDGKKTKTINIKLKEDKKNGYFGKIDAGAATDKYYQEQLLFNKFWGKKKLSAYGTLANTGKTGLGWEDSNKYGASNANTEIGDDGSVSIYISGGDDLDSFDGRYNGQGIPVARTGGLHFDNKFNGDKESINTNYKTGFLNVKGNRDNLSQNTLPTGLIKSNTAQDFNNSIFRQKLDAAYSIKLDTTSTLKITIDGTIKSNKTRNNYLATSQRGNDTLLNRSNRILTNDGDEKILNASLFYTKKFKKKGRTFSANFTEALDQSNTKGYLNTEIDYYNNLGRLDSTQRINQYKTTDLQSSVFNSNFTFSEPLTKTVTLTGNYRFILNNSSINRLSYNQSLPGEYDRVDNTLSSNYKLNQTSNQAGAVFNYKKNKTIFNFGTKIAAVNFDQTDLYTQNELKRNFINYNPQASYQYRFSAQRSIHMDYNGNNTQPNLDQIQPVRVNTDPLNITIGNPDLKPSFTNRFNMYYNSYKIISGQSIYTSLGYSTTSNAIISNTMTDSAGKSTYQSINLRGKQTANFYFYGGYYQKIKKLDIDAGLNGNANGNTYYSYTNGVLNKTQSYTYAVSARLSKYKEKKYEVSLSAGPTYTRSQSSLLTAINNNGTGFNANGDFGIYLPKKFRISTDQQYTYQGKTASFNQDFQRLIINASLSKAFFKDESLKLMISGNDLLNQNVGFNRSATSTLLTQSTYTTIRRYFMFSIVYDFSKMGGAPQK
ncbi:outer membrane beta-barrel family protein [Mucilaginibacter arboris]|uniref:Outer membrane beta-barrel protein n=1 Tax=Mucilaginibacter arboris TaxID=2682090 RepID=A0A7K1T0R6_9SPHI|nr:outer membrane beta-barrel family protein [Mucilaginibacter arboris]MVN23166.1 outer membrane beta-barrel protein [Mucilaginibacter arboris]